MKKIIQILLVTATIAIVSPASASPSNIPFNVPVDVTIGPGITQGATPVTQWEVFCAVLSQNSTPLAQGVTRFSNARQTGTVNVVAVPTGNWQNNPSLTPATWTCSILFWAALSPGFTSVNVGGVDESKSVLITSGKF